MLDIPAYDVAALIARLHDRSGCNEEPRQADRFEERSTAILPQIEHDSAHVLGRQLGEKPRHVGGRAATLQRMTTHELSPTAPAAEVSLPSRPARSPFAALRESRGAEEPYDGVAELWWDSREDMEAALAAPEAQQAARELLEDEQRFIDLGRSALWIARERPIVG